MWHYIKVSLRDVKKEEFGVSTAQHSKNEIRIGGNNKLCYCFVDLAKEYGRVAKAAMWQCL